MEAMPRGRQPHRRRLCGEVGITQAFGHARWHVGWGGWFAQERRGVHVRSEQSRDGALCEALGEGQHEVAIVHTAECCESASGCMKTRGGGEKAARPVARPRRYFFVCPSGTLTASGFFSTGIAVISKRTSPSLMNALIV